MCGRPYFRIGPPGGRTNRVWAPPCKPHGNPLVPIAIRVVSVQYSILPQFFFAGGHPFCTPHRCHFVRPTGAEGGGIPFVRPTGAGGQFQLDFLLKRDPKN